VAGESDENDAAWSGSDGSAGALWAFWESFEMIEGKARAMVSTITAARTPRNLPHTVVAETMTTTPTSRQIEVTKS